MYLPGAAGAVLQDIGTSTGHPEHEQYDDDNGLYWGCSDLYLRHSLKRRLEEKNSQAPGERDAISAAPSMLRALVGHLGFDFIELDEKIFALEHLVYFPVNMVGVDHILHRTDFSR